LIIGHWEFLKKVGVVQDDASVDVVQRRSPPLDVVVARRHRALAFVRVGVIDVPGKTVKLYNIKGSLRNGTDVAFTLSTLPDWVRFGHGVRFSI